MLDTAKTLLRAWPLCTPLIALKGLVARPTAQNEEAGIIADLIARHEMPRCFVEFGFSGWEFNCASLASDWDGLLIDGDAYNTRIARVVLPRRVKAETAWLTLDNLERVHRYADGREIGILSIDVDGNDYWFLENLIGLRPAIIIAEYNATFGQRPITVPYDPAFDRRTKSADWTYYGASLSALTGLAQVHGYRLVKVTENGFNAFFLRDDLASDSDPAIDPHEALNDRPMWNGQRPSECFQAIADMPFVTPTPLEIIPGWISTGGVAVC